MNDKINIAFKQLESWIDHNGFVGFDPYDIKANKFVLQITKLGYQSRVAEIFREILFEMFILFPNSSRKLFAIKPKANAKGIAILATSYFELFKLTHDKVYFDKAQSCLYWLENNFTKTTDGIGWGYPFDWQTKILVPAFTPNGIVTTAAGEIYWNFYKHTNESQYLQRCDDICNFLASLPKDILSNHKLCFSYTPLFRNHVHNLNLFVAEFLIKTGKETGNSKWIELGLKAVNYSISYQLGDGSFDYDGPPEIQRNFRDNYHTGFVLRMLFSIFKLTNDENVLTSLNRCYKHYVNNFFIDKTIPKFRPETLYRIDIHSCSESIFCLNQLSELFPEGKEIANNVLLWTINNLQDKSGYFYHGIFKSRFGFTFKSKIPYLRWGQAWMLRAFSEYFKMNNSVEKK